MSTASQPALAQVLLASARHIDQVLNGASLTDCLAQTASAVRAASQAHSFYCLRHLGLAQELRRLLVPRQPKDGVLDALILQSLLLTDVAIRFQANKEAFSDRVRATVWV